ncbi:hypothetical protein [Sneathiella sp.]|uniref:hypothetical protein n=1 Tax=Sneathiella sp. TaxID=1964365 RepID=UPI0035623C2E
MAGSSDTDGIVSLSDYMSSTEPVGSGKSRVHFNDSSGGGGGNMTIGIKDYIDAKNDAVRSDIKSDIARVEAKIDIMPAKIAWQIGVGVVATVGLVLAVIAYGGARFDGGTSLGSSVGAQVEKNRQSIDDATKAIDSVNQTINKKNDQVLNAIKEMRSGKQP